MLLIGATLVVGSVQLDALQRAGEERIVAQGVAALERSLSDTVRDSAFWDDGVRYVVNSLDLDWIDNNLGRYITETYGWDATFVVDGGGNVAYAQIDGERHRQAVGAPPSPSLARLTARMQELRPDAPQSMGAVVEIEGLAYLAGAAAILPQTDAVTLPEGPHHVLVFAVRLDDALLTSLENDFGLHGLALNAAPGAADAALAAVPLRDPDGRPMRWITWSPQRPGQRQLAWLAPELLLSLLVFGAFTALAMRNIRSTTEGIRRSEARFRDIAEAASDWIWETNAALRFTYVSSTGLAAMSRRPDQVLGRPLHEVLLPAGASAAPLADPPGLGAFRDLLCRLGTSGHEPRMLRVAGKPVLDKAGRVIGYRGTATDITSEMAALEQARYLAEHDVLTGLPNRLLLQERLGEALLRSARYGEPGAILCLDLDRFKEVNDSLGHGIGDALLVRCAERLRACVRETDTVARLGGDEFAILQTGLEQIGDVQRLCERIVATIAEPFLLEGHEIMVTTSIGIALVPTDGRDAARLLQNADIALYRAKAVERGGFCFFETGMDEELQRRKRLEAELRAALSGGQLELNYQPQVDPSDRTIVGVEALLRWRHPERGLVPPQEFIPLAEETGLILPIGEWVLRTACVEARRWPDLRMSVNVSAVQFRQRDLVERVAQALSAAGLEPERLELEITESILLQNTEEALATLGRLKALGVKVAMDDFGTGYSSLSYLQKFPFDKIKIDRSFVLDMHRSGEAAAIVRAIVQLGHSLGMRTCAEGVENQDQLDRLRREGCGEAQGFLFGRPSPAARIDALLAAGSSAGLNGASGASPRPAPFADALPIKASCPS